MWIQSRYVRSPFLGGKMLQNSFQLPKISFRCSGIESRKVCEFPVMDFTLSVCKKRILQLDSIWLARNSAAARSSRMIEWGEGDDNLSSDRSCSTLYYYYFYFYYYYYYYFYYYYYYYWRRRLDEVCARVCVIFVLYSPLLYSLLWKVRRHHQDLGLSVPN